jgi:hypothetical protein
MVPIPPFPIPARELWLCVASVVAFTAGAGCATVGRSFPSERVQSIVVGTTTKGEITSRFGRPYRRGIEDGDSTWTYLHYKLRLLGGQSDTRDLYIRFDGEKVRSYTYNADVP